MRIKLTDRFDGFYFIGIGGVSMSALAKYLLTMGKRVGGCDLRPNAYTEALAEMGACIYPYDDLSAIAGYGLAVYTDAVREDDARLCAAARQGKPLMSRGQLLYEVSREFRRTIAVSGCHGKTTCTAMLAHIFAAAGRKFACHIGGNDKTFSNFYMSGRDCFITEACEYKKNFLLLKPDTAIVLNSEPDHLECYGSERSLRDSYLSFASSADLAVTLRGDIALPSSVSFGFDKGADYCAANVKSEGGRYSFNICEGGVKLGRVSLDVYGRHNILNALSATAAARAYGIDFTYIRDGLRAFDGVERRFERIGAYNGAVCIADYAHHPTEITAVIRTAQRLVSGRMFVVFQPHTYSRTKNLFRQFVKALSPLDNLLIYRTFAAREYYDDGGSALTLSRSVKKSRYGEDVRDIESFLSCAGEEDCVLFIGAGDIYDIARAMLKAQSTC